MINYYTAEGTYMGTQSSRSSYATSTTWKALSSIANHRHSDGIPLSLLQYGERFYKTEECNNADEINET